jgi:hypothetical protein
MKPTRLLIAVLASLAMTSCATSETYRWQEEVLLHDGRVIVVERSVRTGDVPVELGQPPGTSDMDLTFSTADGRSVTWEAGKSFRPMILDFFDGTPYVVATGRTGPDYERHGCPRPPYFIFLYDGQRWERLDYERLPKNIRKANLLVAPTGDEDRFAAVKRGKITVDDVKQSHRWLPSHYKEIKENAPNPCANRRDDFKYVPSKKS